MKHKIRIYWLITSWALFRFLTKIIYLSLGFYLFEVHIMLHLCPLYPKNAFLKTALLTVYSVCIDNVDVCFHIFFMNISPHQIRKNTFKFTEFLTTLNVSLRSKNLRHFVLNPLMLKYLASLIFKLHLKTNVPKYSTNIESKYKLLK